MYKPVTSSFASGCALALALAYPAASDPYADSVDSFTLPNAGCLVAGGTCDVSGDDGDDGADALGAPEGNNVPEETTSLGWDSDTLVGGVLTLDFDNNLCLDGPGDDLVMAEGVDMSDETYDIDAGLQGGLLANVATGGFGDQSVDVGVSFNRIRLTATGSNVNALMGADIDGATCNYIVDIADIIKTNTGDAAIDAGGGVQQDGYSFTIEVQNNTGEDGLLDGLIFADSVPGEFDLDPDAEDLADLVDDGICADGTCDGVDVSNLGDCNLDVDRPNGAKKKGGAKLEPELITLIPDGLMDGDSCIIEVFAITDGKTFPNGRSPDFAPTSCVETSGGPVIALNNGVVVEDELGNVLLQDDDQILLACTQL